MAESVNCPPLRSKKPGSGLLPALAFGVLLLHWLVLGAFITPALAAVSATVGLEVPLTALVFSTRSIPNEKPDTPRLANEVPPAMPRQRATAQAQPETDAARPSTEVTLAEVPPAEPSAPEPAYFNDRVLVSALDASSLASLEPPAASGASTGVAAVSASARARKLVAPDPVKLKYAVHSEISGIPLNANGELLWQHDGKSYNARMEISHFLLGSRVQTSKGTLGPQGLLPIRFGDKVRSEVAAHFEREKGKVSFSANTPDVPLQEDAQDQLSVFMQLAAMVGDQPERFVPGTTLEFQAVGPRSAEEWVFHVGSNSKLKLPGGELNALQLVKEPGPESDVRAEIWLAPSLQYMPVRIRLTQKNGDIVDQQWSATQAIP